MSNIVQEIQAGLLVKWSTSTTSCSQARHVRWQARETSDSLASHQATTAPKCGEHRTAPTLP